MTRSRVAPVALSLFASLLVGGCSSSATSSPQGSAASVSQAAFASEVAKALAPPQPVLSVASAAALAVTYTEFSTAVRELAAVDAEFAGIASEARRACEQGEQRRLDQLDVEISALLLRAAAIPDARMASLVHARAAPQDALTKGRSGLTTCDNKIWLSAVDSLNVMADELRDATSQISSPPP